MAPIRCATGPIATPLKEAWTGAILEEGANKNEGGDVLEVGRDEVLILLQINHQISFYTEYRIRFVGGFRSLGYQKEVIGTYPEITCNRLLLSNTLILALSSLLLLQPISPLQIA